MRKLAFSILMQFELSRESRILERQRIEFLESGLKFEDKYELSRCTKHHAPICLSEYAASRLSAKFMSDLAVTKAIAERSPRDAESHAAA